MWLGLIITALLGLLLLTRWRCSFCRERRRATSEKLRVSFLHPDLGIGGAERLVVDAAVALQARGHAVSITTAHHDAERCFKETRDGTLDVRVAGAVVPRQIFGRLHIVCATLRGLAGAAWLVVADPACDAVVVDQVSAPVPLLRACGLPVLFYCHFPDKLLASGVAAAAAATATSSSPAAAAAAAAATAAADAQPAANSTSGGFGDLFGEWTSLVSRLVKGAYRLPFNLLEEVRLGKQPPHTAPLRLLPPLNTRVLAPP